MLIVLVTDIDYYVFNFEKIFTHLLDTKEKGKKKSAQIK